MNRLSQYWKSKESMKHIRKEVYEMKSSKFSTDTMMDIVSEFAETIKHETGQTAVLALAETTADVLSRVTVRNLVYLLDYYKIFKERPGLGKALSGVIQELVNILKDPLGRRLLLTLLNIHAKQIGNPKKNKSTVSEETLQKENVQTEQNVIEFVGEEIQKNTTNDMPTGEETDTTNFEKDQGSENLPSVVGEGRGNQLSDLNDKKSNESQDEKNKLSATNDPTLEKSGISNRPANSDSVSSMLPESVNVDRSDTVQPRNEEESERHFVKTESIADEGILDSGLQQNEFENDEKPTMGMGEVHVDDGTGNTQELTLISTNNPDLNDPLEDPEYKSAKDLEFIASKEKILSDVDNEVSDKDRNVEVDVSAAATPDESNIISNIIQAGQSKRRKSTAVRNTDRKIDGNVQLTDQEIKDSSDGKNQEIQLINKAEKTEKQPKNEIVPRSSMEDYQTGKLEQNSNSNDFPATNEIKELESKTAEVDIISSKENIFSNGVDNRVSTLSHENMRENTSETTILNESNYNDQPQKKISQKTRPEAEENTKIDTNRSDIDHGKRSTSTPQLGETIEEKKDQQVIEDQIISADSKEETVPSTHSNDNLVSEPITQDSAHKLTTDSEIMSKEEEMLKEMNLQQLTTEQIKYENNNSAGVTQVNEDDITSVARKSTKRKSESNDILSPSGENINIERSSDLQEIKEPVVHNVTTKESEKNDFNEIIPEEKQFNKNNKSSVSSEAVSHNAVVDKSETKVDNNEKKKYESSSPEISLANADKGELDVSTLQENENIALDVGITENEDEETGHVNMPYENHASSTSPSKVKIINKTAKIDIESEEEAVENDSPVVSVGNTDIIKVEDHPNMEDCGNNYRAKTSNEEVIKLEKFAYVEKVSDKTDHSDLSVLFNPDSKSDSTEVVKGEHPDAYMELGKQTRVKEEAGNMSTTEYVNEDVEPDILKQESSSGSNVVTVSATSKEIIENSEQNNTTNVTNENQTHPKLGQSLVRGPLQVFNDVSKQEKASSEIPKTEAYNDPHLFTEKTSASIEKHLSSETEKLAEESYAQDTSSIPLSEAAHNRFVESKDPVSFDKNVLPKENTISETNKELETTPEISNLSNLLDDELSAPGLETNEKGFDSKSDDGQSIKITNHEELDEEDDDDSGIEDDKDTYLSQEEGAAGISIESEEIGNTVLNSKFTIDKKNIEGEISMNNANIHTTETEEEKKLNKDNESIILNEEEGLLEPKKTDIIGGTEDESLLLPSSSLPAADTDIIAVKEELLSKESNTKRPAMNENRKESILESISTNEDGIDPLQEQISQKPSQKSKQTKTKSTHINQNFIDHTYVSDSNIHQTDQMKGLEGQQITEDLATIENTDNLEQADKLVKNTDSNNEGLVSLPPTADSENKLDANSENKDSNEELTQVPVSKEMKNEEEVESSKMLKSELKNENSLKPDTLQQRVENVHDSIEEIKLKEFTSGDMKTSDDSDTKNIGSFKVDEENSSLVTEKNIKDESELISKVPAVEDDLKDIENKRETSDYTDHILRKSNTENLEFKQKDNMNEMPENSELAAPLAKEAQTGEKYESDESNIRTANDSTLSEANSEDESRKEEKKDSKVKELGLQDQSTEKPNFINRNEKNMQASGEATSANTLDAQSLETEMIENESLKSGDKDKNSVENSASEGKYEKLDTDLAVVEEKDSKVKELKLQDENTESPISIIRNEDNTKALEDATSANTLDAQNQETEMIENKSLETGDNKDKKSVENSAAEGKSSILNAAVIVGDKNDSKVEELDLQDQSTEKPNSINRNEKNMQASREATSANTLNAQNLITVMIENELLKTEDKDKNSAENSASEGKYEKLDADLAVVDEKDSKIKELKLQDENTESPISIVRNEDNTKALEDATSANTLDAQNQETEMIENESLKMGDKDEKSVENSASDSSSSKLNAALIVGDKKDSKMKELELLDENTESPISISRNEENKKLLEEATFVNTLNAQDQETEMIENESLKMGEEGKESMENSMQKTYAAEEICKIDAYKTNTPSENGSTLLKTAGTEIDSHITSRGDEKHNQHPSKTTENNTSPPQNKKFSIRRFLRLQP